MTVISPKIFESFHPLADEHIHRSAPLIDPIFNGCGVTRLGEANRGVQAHNSNISHPWKLQYTWPSSLDAKAWTIAILRASLCFLIKIPRPHKTLESSDFLSCSIFSMG